MANGIAMMPDRSFLIANHGGEGGVWRLAKDGALTPFLMEVEGAPLGSVNFVALDANRDVWVTISTRDHSQHTYRADRNDGYVVKVDRRGARIVADALGFTNECRVDPSGRWLYVNETFGLRTSRFAITGDALGPKEIVYEYGPCEFPDGISFDVEGGAWVACALANRVMRIAPNGEARCIIDNSDLEMIRHSDQRYREGKLDATDMMAGRSRPLGNVTSVAFGGSDLKTAYLGSIAARRLATFPSPVAGAPPVHWDF
jgi:sugar lactone lactonase YvrE